ncbi:MAG: hypothetical protein GOMPHAMPRED_000623 [Gomphillus americanus]|uniref:Cytochrome c oxidase assembly protein n=1 Tax=Gomphillus americanus TaxID=1940652 RepID=A0A8H3EER9_9LECA|nr:MAG: hypothetical protein GOMPHAMPRED_000623 [Gomphillus americanus]
MSLRSKLTLGATSLSAIGIVVFVHWSQQAEKAAMHAGVVRDMEQQRLKKERLADFEMQRTLENEYRKIQNAVGLGVVSSCLCYDIADTTELDAENMPHGDKAMQMGGIEIRRAGWCKSARDIEEESEMGIEEITRNILFWSLESRENGRT